MGAFEIKRSKDDKYYFVLKAANGEIIATGEIYNTLKSCRNGVESVIKNAPAAPVRDTTAADCGKAKNPKFEIFRDKVGEFRFRLTAPNGRIIAVSEGYAARSGCKNGIESIRVNVLDASLIFSD